MMNPKRAATKSKGMLLGAALGDAMGWPFEDRARKAPSSSDDKLLTEWTKRSGGRFQPHEERIRAGDYSDDTQLLVAVGRARLFEGDWWQYLARVELPFWSLYHRGAGGASLRAVRLLQKGALPWEAAEPDRAKYFSAGGNGVAMRIAAHSILGGADEDFSLVAKNVVTDGVLTHGHPIALVGALSYAYALWFAFRKEDTLEYGELLNAVHHYQDEWSPIPDLNDRWPSWSKLSSKRGYHEVWHDAVDEMLGKLDLAASGLGRGALDFDDEVIKSLGGFDKHVNGAGTVAAAASLFLASKYVTAPMKGVVRAATARGMDTDTVASMTGTLLGAINGADWLLPSARAVQDEQFLSDLAQRLLTRTAYPSEVGSARSDNVVAALRSIERGDENVLLPIGTRARVVGDGGVESKSTKLKAKSWRLIDEFGQTFFIKKFAKVQEGDTRTSTQKAFELRSDPPVTGHLAGVSLLTANLQTSRFFYTEMLGLEISRETPDLVGLGPNLVLRASTVGPGVGEGTVVYIEVSDIEACRARLTASPSARVSSVRVRSGRSTITCFDPDGRTIEILQK